MKASGIRTAPPGHHSTKDDRRARAIYIASFHRNPDKCTCGNHPKAEVKS